ncbi:MAG: hypothetical protein EXR62_11450 [Chloroflexi bacterium]|nr:hypothetical protein [Chloroflexota bacterium]
MSPLIEKAPNVVAEVREKLNAVEAIYVQPRIVVEVLFNDVQESSQFNSGLALRFARIFRVREDKGPEEADTVQSLRRLYEEQFKYKGSPSGEGLEG